MQAPAAAPPADDLPGTLRYSLGPFEFESDIALPELRSGRGEAGRRVRILLGATPTQIDQGVPVDQFCSVSSTQYLLDILKVARFHVSGGSQVVVEPHPGAAPADLRLYLLGSVFGALCHQNGLLPLHASAVERAGRVTAFLGHSGAGKSTLAAFLARRGHRIVSDDICLLDLASPEASGKICVIPVAGWLKLWRQSLEVLGEAADEENRLLSEDDKFRVFLGDHTPRALALENVVLLERPDGQAEQGPAATPALATMGTLQAVVALMELTYLAYIPESNGGRELLFRQCAAVLNQTRAFRLMAPLGWDRMDGVLDLLEGTLFSGRP